MLAELDLGFKDRQWTDNIWKEDKVVGYSKFGKIFSAPDRNGKPDMGGLVYGLGFGVESW